MLEEEINTHFSRAPLNAVPAWIVQILEVRPFTCFMFWLSAKSSLVVFLQTYVTLKRIAVYLDEEEVTDQVSSLKKDHSEPHLFGDDEGLGLEGATLKWNEVVEVGKQLDQNKASSSSTNLLEADEASTVVGTESFGDRGDRVFELRNISIRFPEGELTVVTGPTASGKTALLVSL